MPVVSTDTTEAVVYLRNEQQLGVVRSKQVCTTRRNASHTHLQNLMLVTGYRCMSLVDLRVVPRIMSHRMTRPLT